MDMLELRNNMKRKKPDFARQDSGLKKQFRGSWRRPKGLHSKLRLAKKGHGKCPRVGYSSPKPIRGLMRNGKELFVINNFDDLKGFKDGCLVIGSNVGLKKRIVLLEEIAKRNLNFFGVKDVSKHIEDIKSRVSKRKNEKKARKEKRAKTREEIKKRKKEEKEKAEKKDIKDDTKKGKIEEKKGVVAGRKEDIKAVRNITAPKSQ